MQSVFLHLESLSWWEKEVRNWKLPTKMLIKLWKEIICCAYVVVCSFKIF